MKRKNNVEICYGGDGDERIVKGNKNMIWIWIIARAVLIRTIMILQMRSKLSNPTIVFR